MKNGEDIRQFPFSGDIQIENIVIEKEVDESESFIDYRRLLYFKLKQFSLSEREDAFSNCSVSQQNTALPKSSVAYI